MKKNLGKLLLVVGLLASGAASLGCPWFLLDEPTADDQLFN